MQVLCSRGLVPGKVDNSLTKTCGNPSSFDTLINNTIRNGVVYSYILSHDEVRQSSSKLHVDDTWAV